MKRCFHLIELCKNSTRQGAQNRSGINRIWIVEVEGFKSIIQVAKEEGLYFQGRKEKETTKRETEISLGNRANSIKQLN